MSLIDRLNFEKNGITYFIKMQKASFLKRGGVYVEEVVVSSFVLLWLFV